LKLCGNWYSGDTGISGVVKIEDASGNVKEQFLEGGFFNFLNKVSRVITCSYIGLCFVFMWQGFDFNSKESY
jgi:hypothetical protein